MERDTGEGWIAKEHQETLGSRGYVHQLVCINGFMGGPVFKTHQIVCYKYVQFIDYQLSLNSAACKEEKRNSKMLYVRIK